LRRLKPLEPAGDGRDKHPEHIEDIWADLPALDIVIVCLDEPGGDFAWTQRS
jgi:hypothetical protein